MKRRGFANPEYLLTLMFVAITLAIVIPAFSRARQKARALRALGQLRGAVSRYAEDHKGAAPGDLSELVQGRRYLAEIPAVAVGLHSASAQVHILGVTDDSGGWTYSNWPGAARQGEVWINCTHTDSRGKAWNAY